MYHSYSNLAIQAFIEGKVKKVRNVISTGSQLTYHGNLIAEWRSDGLYISNGGYTTYSRGGEEIPGSATTKGYLNQLPKVRVNQSKCKWYLNGIEWDGEFIKVEGTTAPTIEVKNLNFFDESTIYIKTDGWRGYSKPKYAVAGANNTGNFSDSPCPTYVCEQEIKGIQAALNAAGIKTKQVVCETSNVFCVHVYLIVWPSKIEQAKQVVSDYLEANVTRLLYAA